jgi:hypothetical protein
VNVTNQSSEQHKRYSRCLFSSRDVRQKSAGRHVGDNLMSIADKSIIVKGARPMKGRTLRTTVLVLLILAAVTACAGSSHAETPIPSTPTLDAQATIEAAVEATRAALPTDEPPTPVPTDIPVPTPTPVPPTDTPIPLTDTPIPPTDTPISLTDTPIPPTFTPIPPVATLLEPRDGAQSLGGNVTFKWSYPRPLAAHEGFQVLIWKEGNPHWGVAELWGDTQQTINLDAVLPERGGSGEYFWTVVVRERATEALLSPEAPAWRFTYGGSNDPCASCNCQQQCRSGNCSDCCEACCDGCK